MCLFYQKASFRRKSWLYPFLWDSQKSCIIFNRSQLFSFIQIISDKEWRLNFHQKTDAPRLLQPRRWLIGQWYICLRAILSTKWLGKHAQYFSFLKFIDWHFDFFLSRRLYFKFDCHVCTSHRTMELLHWLIKYCIKNWDNFSMTSSNETNRLHYLSEQ